LTHFEKLSAVILLSLTPALVSSQTAAPAFEVASVRSMPRDSRTWALRRVNPERYQSLSNVMQLLTWAWQVKNYQILGGPAWLSQERFEIQGTTGHMSSVDEERLMVQILLANRFGLKLHRDHREVPVYSLVVGKGDPRVSIATEINQIHGRGINIESGKLVSRAGTMAELVDVLTTNLDRPVFDSTGLTGRYDFNLTWDQPGAASGGSSWAPIGPALFSSIRDLGLRLDPRKATIEILVIDAIDRPSGN
jgi:uncharacterized protein (TIGR03435 family)